MLVLDMDIVKLIKLVQSNRNIWDKKCKEYSNRDLSKITWNLIGEELDMPVEICKSKWCNLRDTFRKEYNKTAEHRLIDENYVSRWKYYEKLLFLLNQMGPGNFEIRCKSEIQQQDTSLDSEEQHQQQINKNNEDIIGGGSEAEASSSSYTTPSAADASLNKKSILAKQQPYRKRCSQQTTNNDDDDDEFLKLQKSKLHKLNDDNIMMESNRMFLQSLLPFFKSFTTEKNLIVRNKIQSIILEEISKDSFTNQNQQQNEVILNYNLSHFSTPIIADVQPTSSSTTANLTTADTHDQQQQENPKSCANMNNVHQESSLTYFENNSFPKFESSVNLPHQNM